MQVFQKSRPSPAMIVAVIALSFAVVGTAVAGTDGLERKVTKSKVKKIAKKQANKRITAREPSLNVNSAKTADIGLSPVAYARVTADGNVDEAATRGVTDDNVSLQSTSAFCFRGLGFQFKTAQATPDYASYSPPVDAYNDIVSVAIGNPFADCAEGDTQLEAATWDTDGAGTFEPSGFFIWFYN